MDAKEAETLDKAYTDGFANGYKRALEDYAWWKDGIQYVGCGVKTLKQALEESPKET